MGRYGSLILQVPLVTYTHLTLDITRSAYAGSLVIDLLEIIVEGHMTNKLLKRHSQ